MDKKEYIVRQLGRTKNKKYEAYVVTRIIHLLNDFDIKFVTQQYVARPDEYALIDLYFPQLNILIEVDEKPHQTPKNITLDKIRDADIVNAIGNEPIRIDVTASLERINAKIDDVVREIRAAKAKAEAASRFIPWDLDAEFNSETYIKKGSIKLEDNVAFKTMKDACNCFGHNYSGYQKGGACHPYLPNTKIWFPKLFPNGEWDNQISADEEIIYERSANEAKVKEHVIEHLNSDINKRIVFGKVKGNLGDVLYRFRGLYELDRDESSPEKGLIWRRISTEVKTFPPMTLA